MSPKCLPNVSQMSPKCLQNVPKMSPKRPQNVPKTSPKRTQNVPKTSPKHPQNVPKTSIKRPQCFSNAIQVRPQSVPNAIFIYFRRFLLNKSLELKFGWLIAKKSSYKSLRCCRFLRRIPRNLMPVQIIGYAHSEAATTNFEQHTKAAQSGKFQIKPINIHKTSQTTGN